ncbi:MAG: alcohol dehydrogenase catalytic domain-containing protein [Christensenellaceae bacterium]
MKDWILDKTGTLSEQERPENKTDERQVKVRVTKVMLADTEHDLLNRRLPSAIFPVTPGRAAVGVISEGCDCGLALPKGTRVYLHPLLPCGACKECMEKAPCNDMKIAGVNAHGFLRDFAVARIDNVSLLPSSVSDESALFIEWIALAESIVDALNAKKGQHVVVFGATLLGNLVAQALVYRQIPAILVDKNPEALAYAQKCGVYYTVLADNNLYDRVYEITGGRLASASVYTTFSELDPTLAFRLVKSCGIAVFGGLTHPDVQVNLLEAMQKQINIVCVNNGKKHISSAINLLANKAIGLVGLEPVYLTTEHLPLSLKTFAAGSLDFRKPQIVKLF